MSFSFSKATKGAVAGGLAVLIAANGFALPSQGAVGATSTGTLDITLTVLDEVRISNLTDIPLGSFLGDDLVGSSPACVYRSGTGLYGITAEGDGTGDAFILSETGGAEIPYVVTYDDGTGAESLTTGTPLTGRSNGDKGSDTCTTTGNNGTIEVTVASGDMAGKTAAAYTGTLTLTVAPE